MKALAFALGLLLGILGTVGVNYWQAAGPLFGATTARTTITNPWTFSNATTTTKNIDTGTSNTATSTIIVGCNQFYATSTASPMRVIPAAFASTTVTFGNGTSGFPLVAVFGACPRI
jgi:hypothetical protein